MALLLLALSVVLASDPTFVVEETPGEEVSEIVQEAREIKDTMERILEALQSVEAEPEYEEPEPTPVTPTPEPINGIDDEEGVVEVAEVTE